MSQSDFIHLARERGFIHQITDEESLTAQLSAGPVSAYLGFDLTADSLHVGHLLPLMLMRLFKECGGTPVILLGGGTSMIGDPSGRDTSRTLMTPMTIQRNLLGIRDSILSLVGEDAILVDNADWLTSLNHLNFLRDVGSHFSVNRMLGLDSVKNRLDREQPLTCLEFGYTLLQSYDFVELQRRHNVTVQFGGSDQWGNIVMGIDFARKMDGVNLFGVTVPLLTTASGSKMGKTENGAVWLNPAKLSVFDFWQFWRNTEDADVGRFLGMFTDLPMTEVRRLGALQGADINHAKKVLATRVTALLHGVKAANEVLDAAQAVFEEESFSANLPIFFLRAGSTIVDAVVAAGFAPSKTAARRLIEQGGIRLDWKPVTDYTIIPKLDSNDLMRLSAGKKRHVLLGLES